MQIPRGKGMAGQAWVLDEPVQVCNLKTDAHTAIQPGARTVSAQGAIALPVHDKSGAVRAVVGFAFEDERPLQPDELSQLIELAEALPDGY
jgi:L-methionine (R)-S-oxide reductase